MMFRVRTLISKRLIRLGVNTEAKPHLYFDLKRKEITYTIMIKGLMYGGMLWYNDVNVKTNLSVMGSHPDS